jgi:cytochrome d ubiquinol oxidase subunit I
MLLLGLWGAWARWRHMLFESRSFLGFALVMGPAGLIAILAGWMTTEIGRQPWVVYGVMRTKDAVSNHSALEMSVTLILFIILYAAVFGTGIRYLLQIVARGPQSLDGHSPEPDPETGRPARPLSAVPDRLDAAPIPGSERR